MFSSHNSTDSTIIPDIDCSVNHLARQYSEVNLTGSSVGDTHIVRSASADTKCCSSSRSGSGGNSSSKDYTAYFFGYGSLMNVDELAKCLQVSRQDILSRILFVKVTGISRGWLNQCSSSSGSLFVDKHHNCNGLQLSPTYLCCYLDPNKNAEINGILLPVTDTEKQLIHTREKGGCYGITQLRSQQIKCYSCNYNHLDSDLPSYFYCCQLKRTSQATKFHPIVQSYVDVCLAGTLDIDKLLNSTDHMFSRTFIATTKFWSAGNWVNDRLYKYRPTTVLPQAHVINKLLVDNLPYAVIRAIQF